MTNMDKSIKMSKVGWAVIAISCLMMVLYLRGFTPNDTIYLLGLGRKICLKELLVASIEAAERGGRVVVKVKEDHNLQEKSKGKTKEGVNNPVTQGDIYSHIEMYYGLQKAFPNLRIVSEEKSKKGSVNDVVPISLYTKNIEKEIASSLDSDVFINDVTVWIDPLDATKEYTEDLTQYVTTMVCVAVKGRPVIGVIHFPYEKETVWAWKGHGSSKLQHINTNAKDFNKESMKIIVSRSHAGDVKNIASEIFGSNSQIIPAGGAGYKSTFVARRLAHAYVHTTAIKKWDICAGNALLSQIGGEMTDLNGEPIDYSFPDSDRSKVVLKHGLVGTYKDHYSIMSKIKEHKDLFEKE